jgi:hypothetical protein
VYNVPIGGPKMANLQWAVAYRFDEEEDSYVLTTFDEETDEEQSQLGEQTTLSTKSSFSESDYSDDDDSD